MSFCIKCGAQLEDGTKFCPYCGTQVAMDEMAAQVGQLVEETVAAPVEAVEEVKDEIAELADKAVEEIENKADESLTEIAGVVDSTSEIEDSINDAIAEAQALPVFAENEFQPVVEAAETVSEAAAPVIEEAVQPAIDDLDSAVKEADSFLKSNAEIVGDTSGSFVQDNIGTFNTQPVQQYQQPVQQYQQPVQQYQQPVQQYQQPVQQYQQPAQQYQQSQQQYGQYGQPQYQQPQQQYPQNYQYANAPVPQKSGKKGLLIALIVAGVAILAAIALIIVPKLGKKPSGGGSSGGTVEPGVPGATSTSSAREYWEGDWYGWWNVEEATDSYADYEGDWWDACVNIRFTSDTEATITFWDEDSSKSDYSGLIYAEVYDDGSEHGVLTSTGGYFFGDELESGDWWLSIDTSYGYENLMIMSGVYEDPDGDGGFDYYVVLRPWGTDWSDISEEDDYLLPYYLDGWYSKYSSGTMPEEFDLE